MCKTEGKIFIEINFLLFIFPFTVRKLTSNASTFYFRRTSQDYLHTILFECNKTTNWRCLLLVLSLPSKTMHLQEIMKREKTANINSLLLHEILGSSQQIISFAVSIMVIFLFLLIVSTVLYYYWRKKQTIHRHRLCQLLKQEKLRHRKVS